MKHLREELWFNTPGRRDYINITDKIETLVKKSNVQNGFVLCNAMHITGSVYTNDDEQGLKKDSDAGLKTPPPHAPADIYRHNRTGEDNADAHMKRQIMGREVVVAITD